MRVIVCAGCGRRNACDARHRRRAAPPASAASPPDPTSPARSPEPPVALMKWRKLLMSGGAAVGAAAAYNHVAQRAVGPLQNLLGGEEGSFRWRGHRIAYTKRGDGPPVLLVHGIHAAAWSYEWRSNVDALARGHTVYTVDLLGFGQSDRPGTRYSS